MRLLCDDIFCLFFFVSLLCLYLDVCVRLRVLPYVCDESGDVCAGIACPRRYKAPRLEYARESFNAVVARLPWVIFPGN